MKIIHLTLFLFIVTSSFYIYSLYKENNKNNQLYTKKCKALCASYNHTSGWLYGYKLNMTRTVPVCHCVTKKSKIDKLILNME